MLNFARFIPGTPEADWLRQQVSERGMLEKIDLINEFVNKALEAEDVDKPEEFWQVLGMIEESLRKNMNDPRAKMLIMSYGTIENKEEQPKRKVKVINNPDGEPAPEPTEPAGEGIPDEGTKEPTGEPAGEPDPAEKVDNTEPTGEPTDEGTKEPTTEEPETETPELTEVKEESEKTEEPTSEEESKEPAEETKEEPEAEQSKAKRGRKKAESAEE